MSNFATPAINARFPHTRVLGDTIPGDTVVRDVLLVFAGAGLTTLGAQISIHVPNSPVPVTAQTLGVVLAGAALGTWRGAASQFLYLLLGLFLPIYAGGTSGGAVLWGATGGYIVGFILAAAFTGWAAEHGADRKPLLALATFALGQLAIFGIGVPWLKVSADLSWGTAIHDGFTIFILGGIIKAILAAIAMPTAWRIQRRVSHRTQ
jgi:biotin transport system substrate-specific component